MAEDREDAGWLETRQRLVGAVRSGWMAGKEVTAELGIGAGEL